ncbi:hypothetical protein MW887_004293 [Aspergillus wentii]|nr:hypothetical protein MW887_004293 [Aspergillus wentii]
MKRKKVLRETSDHANSQNSHSHRSVDCVESTSESVEQSIGTAEAKPKEDNLWKIAGARLDEKSQEYLDIGGNSDLNATIQALVDETRAACEEYEKGGFQIQIHGKNINVRDSVQSILISALQVQDIIKAGAAFDPTGHASTAWSVISIGLTVVKNSKDRQDAVMQASDFLAGVLVYYAIVDAKYRDQGVETDQGLEDALIEVYTAVLRYAAAVKRAHRESTAAHVWQSIKALVEDPLERLKAAVEERGKTVEIWRHLGADLDLRQKADKILDYTHELPEKMNNIPVAEQQAYADWKTTPGRFLWLHGVVGCGKSVLCSTIIHNIQTLCEGDRTKQVAYWYFRFSNRETLSMEAMIRFMLRQLSPVPLPKCVNKLWEEHHKGQEPARELLMAVMHQVIEDLSGTTFLILDALDECPWELGNRERDSLFEFLGQLMERHSSKLHILATSRSEPDIAAKLQHSQNLNLHKLDLEEGLSNDVAVFVSNQILHGTLRFRWAELQIKRLEECHVEDDILDALDTIPVNLEATYRNVLERIQPRHQKKAQLILTWLSFSMVPMTLEAVAAAASLPLTRSVMEICTSALISVSPTDNIVRLAHFSVKEFLVSEDSMKDVNWCISSADLCHALIAERSIQCLLDTDEDLTQEAAEKQPLLQYAGKFWDAHFRQAGNPQPPELQDKALLDRNANSFESIPTDFNFHNACIATMKAGRFDVLKVLLQSQQPTKETSLGMIEHFKLAYLDMDEVRVLFDMLWDQHAFFDRFEQDVTTDSDILEKAVANESFGNMLLRWFLDNQEKAKVVITQNLLKGVLRNERHGREMMETLFDRRDADKGDVMRFAPINPSCSMFHAEIEERLLIEASMTGNIERIRSLLESGANVTQDVIAAARSVETMELLLNHWRSDEPIGEEVLLKLVRSSSESDAKAKMLYQCHKAHITVSQAEFIEAVCYSTREVVELLVNIPESNIAITEELLCIAASNIPEPVPVMEYLLQLGGNAISITETVLVSAASSFAEHPEDLFELLLDRFPTVKLTTPVFETAVCNKHLMSFLLDRSDNEAPVKEIVQTLTKLSYNGAEVLEKFLDRELIEVDARLVESFAHNDRALELFSRRRPDLPITHQALINATSNIDSLRILLDALNDNVKINEDIMLAVLDADVMRFLFDRMGPDLPITDNVLIHAAIRPDVATLKFVLEHQDDLDIQAGWEALCQDRHLYFKEKQAVALLEHRMSKLQRK